MHADTGHPDIEARLCAPATKRMLRVANSPTTAILDGQGTFVWLMIYQVARRD